MEIPLDTVKENPEAKKILKALSMPIAQQSGAMKQVSKMSSALTASTVSSSTSYKDKYENEAERLEWGEKCKLTDKHLKIYETCNKYDQDKAKVHYDWVASNYEGMYLRMGYPDPKMVAKYVYKFCKKNSQDPAQVKILDLACGTGLVGKYLAPYNFNDIVGMDISPNMLEEASVKGVYSELHEHTLSQDPNEMPQKFKNKFDYVTCAGLINNNHMDYLLFEEMLLTVKKGGYIIFSARYSFMGKYWYDKIIKEMHDNGRWKLVATDTFFKYDQLECVSIGRFSKTPSKVFVFQKTQEDINTFVNRYDFKLKAFLLKEFKNEDDNVTAQDADK